MGFLSSLGDSLRAHVDERVRSPFAGAFIVAWVTINWRAIVILLFSESTIEERISVVSNDHFTMLNTVWHPLGLAIAIAIGFYLASALFTVLAEFYASAQYFIERMFDRIKWVSPGKYIAYKRSQQEKVIELQGLASDNLQLVEEEKIKTRAVSENLIAAQKNLNELISEVGNKNALIADLRKDVNDCLAFSSEVEDSARAAHDSLVYTAVLMSKISSSVDAVLKISEADGGGDFIYVDKENMILIGNSIREVQSKIDVELKSYVNRKEAENRRREGLGPRSERVGPNYANS